MVFLGKVVLKICSRFTGEHPCRSVILIKLLCNFIKITLQHGRSPVNLLHVFRTSFSKNTSGRLLLLLDLLNTHLTFFLEEGAFPDRLKIARVTQILKKGDAFFLAFLRYKNVLDIIGYSIILLKITYYTRKN